jgi:hypothetical protein
MIDLLFIIMAEFGKKIHRTPKALDELKNWKAPRGIGTPMEPK